MCVLPTSNSFNIVLETSNLKQGIKIKQRVGIMWDLQIGTSDFNYDQAVSNV